MDVFWYIAAMHSTCSRVLITTTIWLRSVDGERLPNAAERDWNVDVDQGYLIWWTVMFNRDPMVWNFIISL